MAFQHTGSAVTHGLSSPGGSSVNLLPSWLGVLMTLVYLAVFLNHLRHAADTSGERRLWHIGHLTMALGMAFMFVPASLDPFTLGNGLWQSIFVAAFAFVAAWLARQELVGNGASGLWLLLAVDLLAMVYMWSPGAIQASLSWLLIAYLTAEAVLWMTGRVLGADRNWLSGGSYSLGHLGAGNGVLGITKAATLACERDLRVSMSAMTLGMAYMVLAMLLMR
jgi:Domain of unknown function (DUF5134)